MCQMCYTLHLIYNQLYVGLCVKIQSLRLKSYKTDEIVVINTLVQENLFLNLVIILMENNYRKWCTQSWQTTLVWESSTVPCLESIFLRMRNIIAPDGKRLESFIFVSFCLTLIKPKTIFQFINVKTNKMNC